MTGGRVSDHFALHPPTTSLLLVPIAWLELTPARVAWLSVNLILLLVALRLLAVARVGQEPVWSILFVAFALLYPPLAENFRVGQTYVLLLFFFALALHAELLDKPRRAGFGLGLAAGLKLSGAPVWLILAARGRWHTLGWSALTLAASALVGLALLGGEGWLAFAARLLDTARPLSTAGHVAFQATFNFTQRMFVSAPGFPAALFPAPWLAGILNLIVTALALGLSVWHARRAALPFAFASGVTLSVILFPSALEYHYTLLLLPLGICFYRLCASRTPLEVAWFTIVLALLYVPVNWNDARWDAPGATVLAYPRLYGGWLLWLLLLTRMREYLPLPASAGARG
jgi:hypothetical protein